MLLHAIVLTYRCFYTQTLLHEKLLHRETLTQRRLYIARFWHIDTFTQRSSYTEKFWIATFYAETILHREAFTQNNFYTQKLSHTDALRHKGFYKERISHTEKKSPQRVAPAHTHSHFTTRSSAPGTISAVAQGQTEFAFQHTFGCPDRCKRLPTNKSNRILTYVWASYTHNPRGRCFAAQTKFAFHHVWASDTHNLVEGHVRKPRPGWAAALLSKEKI